MVYGTNLQDYVIMKPSNKSYDLIIVTGEPFPVGLAATNRLLCYSTAIAKDKKVLVMTYSAPYNCEVDSGTYNQVDFLYMHKKCDRPVKIKRFFLLLYRYIKLCFLLLLNYRCKSILFVSRKSFYAFIIKFIAVLKSASIYREMSELPNHSNKVKQQVARYTNKIFDGIIVISSDLGNSIKSYIHKNAKIFCLPVLVQMDRFEDYRSVHKKNVAFYCSGGNVERDGLLDTLNGFLLYIKKYKTEIKLEIATTLNLSNQYHQDAMAIISSNPEVFTYLGSLPTTLIPQKLMEASVLLLTPHQNYQSKGFPTKLGEYLASGTPIICSSIDDLYDQIPDTIVEFVAPNSPIEVSVALDKLLKNKENADELGLRGRKWVMNNYTMVNYTSSLIDFLKI